MIDLEVGTILDIQRFDQYPGSGEVARAIQDLRSTGEL